MDPLHLDAEALQSLASEPIVRRGIAYHKEHRVMDLGWEPGRLWATVEGSRKDWPYQVRIEADGDGELEVDCDCPFDWEPACKHAVAALLAYAEQQEVEDLEVGGAADEAVEERVRRGRSEVIVEHLSGDPWFGTWKARSVDAGSRSRGGYMVQIRSLGERTNLCGCPDFATNLLGTCKHVEAVLHQLRKRDGERFQALVEAGPPVAMIALAWDAEPEPTVVVQWGARGPVADLAGRFDGDGRLVGALPDAIHQLEQTLTGRDDVQLGDDVVAYARRLGEEAARARRRERISTEIRASGGQLPGVRATLYPYQVQGVAFLAGSGRALLADDMGLGKTLQAIAAASWLTAHDEVRRTLVVCPASLKQQWAREIARFTGRQAVVVSGRADARGALYREHAPFTVVNYELLLRDVEVIQRQLSPDLLILDEAQRIKNWRTRTAASIKAVDSRFAFVLTGTPLENRLEDLYSLMQVVDPRVLGSLWRYMLDFHVMDERGKVLGYRNLSTLRRRLEPVLLRRDRTLVADQLPARTELRLDVAMTQAQVELHDAAMTTAGTLATIARRRKLTPSEEHRLMAALQQARMACDAAGLVDKETEGSPKLDELKRLLEELCVDGGHKVVIFSEWERMTAMSEQVARSLGLGVARLHGGVPTSRRQALIDRFHEDPACQVFISTDAGGVGLNLQCATALINLDLPWNPARLDQRIARIHRLGQKQSVQVVIMVSNEGYEGQVAGLIGSKRELFHHTVHEDASEDAVGISKRMVELALATLDDKSEAPQEAADTEEVEPQEPAVEGELSPVSEGATEDVDEGATPAATEGAQAAEPGPRLDALVADLQRALGARIERIVASGRGLMVVVDQVDAVAEAAVAAASADLPVAAVDARTFAALRRLGSGGEERAVFVRQQRAEPGLVEQARRKLQAAQVLADADCAGEAVALARTAMLLALADRAGLLHAPEPANAAVWVFGELMPRGIVGAELAATVARVLALGEVAEVPAELARGLVADVGGMMA